MRSSDFYKAAKAKIEEAKAIRSKAEAEKRDITAEEDGQILALLAENETLQKKGDTQKRLEAAEAALTEIPEPPPPAFQPLPAEPRDHKVEGMAGFPTAGHFFRAIYEAGEPSIRKYDPRLYATVGSDEANTRAGAQGGFLVPQAVSQQIWDGMATTPDNLLPECDLYTLGTEESITFPAVDETTKTLGSSGGGVTAYRRAELGQMTGSRGKFREITLKPEEIYVYCYVTERLLNSSFMPLEQWLTRKAGEAIASKISDELVAGVGGGACLGVLNAGCTISVAKETGQTADTVVYENILKMWSRCPQAARSGASWYVNQEVEPQLQQMAIGVGTAGTPVYLPPGGLSVAPYGTIFGRPVRVIESCKKVGDVGDIILANFKFMAAAAKGTVASAMSQHIRFDYAQMAFRFQFMVDAQPWLAAAITPANATSGNTLSPFVTLAARA